MTHFIGWEDYGDGAYVLSVHGPDIKSRWMLDEKFLPESLPLDRAQVFSYLRQALAAGALWGYRAGRMAERCCRTEPPAGSYAEEVCKRTPQEKQASREYARRYLEEDYGNPAIAWLEADREGEDVPPFVLKV